MMIMYLYSISLAENIQNCQFCDLAEAMHVLQNQRDALGLCLRHTQAKWNHVKQQSHMIEDCVLSEMA